MTTAVQLAQSVAPGVSLGYKNRLINGAMTIDQRNAGASGTANGYTVDRWQYYGTQASKGTWQQVSGVAPTTQGFTQVLGFTSSSAYSVISTDSFQLAQHIEGYNIADLGWCTANAQPVTVSFWVRSSLTGTFAAALNNNGGNYSYVFNYTVNAANTWQYVTATVPGLTTGSINTTNGDGLQLTFCLGAGSTRNTTAGSWQSGFFIGTTGATSVVGTSGATFYITGVQLEVGTAATNFEFRDYGRELIMCQRYYEKSYDQSVVAGTVSNNGVVWAYNGSLNGGGDCGTTCQFRVSKRTQPTMVWYSPDTGSSGVIGTSGGDITANIQYAGQQSSAVYGNVASTNRQIRVHYTATAEL